MTAASRIGVDESGKGDFFGPLVIAACYMDQELESCLMDVRDSKKLTDKKVLELSREIKSICPHAIVTIGPAKYNDLYKKFNNLNRLLEWGHARAIENALEKKDCTVVISDQFADPVYLKRALFEKGKQVELISRTKAESDAAVAAASILARAEFLFRLKKLSEECGIELPKGASQAVIHAGKRLVQNSGKESLASVGKMHFKTVRSVLD